VKFQRYTFKMNLFYKGVTWTADVDALGVDVHDAIQWVRANVNTTQDNPISILSVSENLTYEL